MKDIQKIQDEFNKKHFPKDEERQFRERIVSLSLALCGEAGEIANIVKKYNRNVAIGSKADAHIDEKFLKQMLGEELADVFIYCITICNLLGIDLEEEYYKKLEFNKQKYFQNL